jgi:hypothetical protein
MEEEREREREGGDEGAVERERLLHLKTIIVE